MDTDNNIKENPPESLELQQSNHDSGVVLNESQFSGHGDRYQGPHHWRKILKPVQSPVHTNEDENLNSSEANSGSR